jgi:hypothetical protein
LFGRAKLLRNTPSIGYQIIISKNTAIDWELLYASFLEFTVVPVADFSSCPPVTDGEVVFHPFLPFFDVQSVDLPLEPEEVMWHRRRCLL